MIDSTSIVDAPHGRKTIMANKVARTIVKAREHDYSSMDEWKDETEYFGEEAYSYHMDNGQIGLVQDDGDGTWLAMIGDDMDQIADGLGFYAEEDLKDLREAQGWIYAMDERAAGEKYNPDGTLRAGDIRSWRDTPKKQAGSHRLARGFHSRWNESDMYDFVDGAIDDINRHTYSDIMAGNFNSYEGDDGEVYTFDIMSDYFTLYVEVDGTNVSISCEDDPSLDQSWDFDEDYSSRDLADDLFSIASDAEAVFIEMAEEEASDEFAF